MTLSYGNKSLEKSDFCWKIKHNLISFDLDSKIIEYDVQ